MSLQAGLVSLLNGKTAVTDLVGNRISWSTSAQTDVSPRVTLGMTSSEHQHHLRAASGFVLANVTVSCYAATSVEAWNLAEQIRLAMDGYRGNAGDVFLSTCHLQGERDIFIEPIDASDNGSFVVEHDYLIGWAVTVPAF